MKLVVYWIPVNGACARFRRRESGELRVDVLTQAAEILVSSDLYSRANPGGAS